MTFHKNSSGIWYIHPTTGNVGSFTEGDVSYTRIYFKEPSYVNSTRRKWVMRHEVGHALCMGHVVSLNKQSIMHESWIDDKPNDMIYYVTQYDINVLEGFYPNP